jgi:hypothetical protein
MKTSDEKGSGCERVDIIDFNNNGRWNDVYSVIWKTRQRKIGPRVDHLK